MVYKNFAGSNEEVSLLGFGCWGIGKSMWIGAEDSESKKALHKAIEQGVTLFDTAYVYGMGCFFALSRGIECRLLKLIFRFPKHL